MSGQLSSLEQMLQLRRIPESPIPAPDPQQQQQEQVFITTRKLWHPPGSRGVFGGVPISQCLAAAQETVPDGFSVHSAHGLFMVTGDATLPIEYHVERVRDGRSFVTRSVLARQQGKSIFSCTLSFMAAVPPLNRTLRHGPTFAGSMPPPPEAEWASSGPAFSTFAPHVVPIGMADAGSEPYERRIRVWIRAPAPIAQAGSTNTHQVILSYMSDWALLSIVPIVHGIWEFPWALMTNHTLSPLTESELTMISSLNHTVFFHEPLKIVADDWILVDVESPWAGGERAMVIGKLFDKHGTLLVTCIQEGLMRLKKSPGKL